LIKRSTYYCLLLLFIISSTHLIAQKKQKVRSSFSKISTKSYSRIGEVQGKLSEAKELFNKNPEAALDLVHDAILIAIQESYPSQEAEAYQILGKFNFELNEYNLSYKNYKKQLLFMSN